MKPAKEVTDIPNIGGRPMIGAAMLDSESIVFLEHLIERSGFINRLLMRVFLSIDKVGLERWYLRLRLTGSRKDSISRKLKLAAYWIIRTIERLCAIYIGGSLTAGEQETFGRICGMEGYLLSRYNSMFFGTLTGALFISSGDLTRWLGEFESAFSTSLSLSSFLLYSFGVVSMAVDIFRLADSFTRKRSHMPIGFFPLIINSTTFIKQIAEAARIKKEK